MLKQVQQDELGASAPHPKAVSKARTKKGGTRPPFWIA